jgi:hypothetical protein
MISQATHMKNAVMKVPSIAITSMGPTLVSIYLIGRSVEFGYIMDERAAPRQRRKPYESE